MKNLFALDIGGTTIDMVEFNPISQSLFAKKSLESDQYSKKNIPEILKAFGILEKILKKGSVIITGASALTLPEYCIENKKKFFLQRVLEFESIARGGKILSGKNSGLVVSLGTGTAMVSFDEKKWTHRRGTGIGGGTFIGLGKAMLGTKKFSELQSLVEGGNLKNIDISVGDIAGGDLGNLSADMTASNFAKFSHLSTQQDIALGIANLVGQSIATLAVEKAKRLGLTTIIIGGKFSRLSFIVDRIETTAKFFGMEVIVPPHAGFMTTIGACVSNFYFSTKLLSH